MENRKTSSVTELIKKIEVVEKYEMFLIGFFTGAVFLMILLLVTARFFLENVI